MSLADALIDPQLNAVPKVEDGRDIDMAPTELAEADDSDSVPPQDEDMQDLFGEDAGPADDVAHEE